MEVLGTLYSLAGFWGLKLEGVDFVAEGDGEISWGRRSMLGTEDNRMGFGGGAFGVLCWFSEGGFGGANLGQSGSSRIWVGDGLEMDTDAVETLEHVEGGFGGAIGGGFSKVKSSSIASEGGLGGGMEGGWMSNMAALSRSPIKYGGGGINCVGGGGGAIDGGGGTIISPSTGSETDIVDPLDR